MGRKEKALMVAIGANIFLVALKFFLAGISGSMALHMSGWHSVQGLFVSLAVFVGFILSRKEDSRMTRGISRIENLVALLISLFVFYLAYKMFIKMTRPHAVMLAHVPIVTVGAMLGATICYLMSRFKIYVGQAAHSPSLVADGYHCRLHVVMEIAVIIGLAGYMIGFTNLDMLAAALVTLFVLQTGFQLFTRAAVSLTSKAVSVDYSCHAEKGRLRIGHPKTALTLATLIILGYILSGFYTIQWNERGIVRRFGRQIGQEISPGIHYHLPWPIGAADKVKVDDIRKLETDAFLILTGDENLIEANVATHYQVKDASESLPDSVRSFSGRPGALFKISCLYLCIRRDERYLPFRNTVTQYRMNRTVIFLPRCGFGNSGRFTAKEKFSKKIANTITDRKKHIKELKTERDNHERVSANPD